MSEYTWISDENIVGDLNAEQSVGCVDFFDFSFTDVNIQRMEQALLGRAVERIVITSCHGKVDRALSFLLSRVRVKCLKLDCMNINPSTASILADGVGYRHSLRSLSLQGITMTDHLAKALHQALLKTDWLQFLYLSVIGTSRVDTVSMELILEGIKCNRSLKHLGIARVRGMDPARVFQSIQSHSSLETISLASMDGIAPETLTALEDLAHSPNRKVTTIKLSVRGDWTGLAYLPKQAGDKVPLRYRLTISTSSQFCDMRQLGEILETNDNIQSLSLAHCGLEEDDIVQLASYLGRVKGLKELYLYGNFLNSGQACEALLNALQHNLSLERIDLPAKVDKRDLLEHHLDCNRAGRRLHKDINAPRGLWPLVLQRASSIDYVNTYPLFRRPEELAARRANVVFHLLQGRALCC